MDSIKDKNLLAIAIDNYELYTSKQKNILKILVNMAIENIATVGTAYLMEKTKLSRPAIYLNLKKFTIEGTINRIRKPGERYNSYELNQKKLDYILQLYKNKKAMEDKN